jgi:hypothetical protein
MTASLLVQYIVIGVLVLISAAVTFHKVVPMASTRLLASASARLNKPWRAAWLRALGRRLQPKQATGNCGDGCSTCGSCGPKPPASARPGVQPLEFRPRNH